MGISGRPSQRGAMLPPPAQPVPPQPLGVQLGISPFLMLGHPGLVDVVKLANTGDDEVFVVRMMNNGGSSALALTRDDLERLRDHITDKLGGPRIERVSPLIVPSV